jgi:hypothetical protein
MSMEPEIDPFAHFERWWHDALNDAGGNLDFWTEAIDRALRRQGPYHPVGVAPARSANGLLGRRLQYVYGDAATGSTYWVTTFVTEARVYVIEAGGPTEAFARARPDIERAIGSFEAF